jgi:hypothetical protein
MLRTCPSHGVDECNILHTFYNDLNYMFSWLDSVAGGAFVTKTANKDKAILKSMVQNHNQ